MSRFGGGGDSLSDRFHYTFVMDGNKPDTNLLSDLRSPRSPLQTQPAASSSSSSSGSIGKLQNPSRRSDSDNGRKSHSCELPGSSDSSPTANARPGLRRSGSGPLAYAGNCSSTASSPATSVLPAGNICPSGRIGKCGMVARAASRTDVLRSGTGNYGHGSIIRGGTGSLGSWRQSAESSRSTEIGTDPQEVTRLGNECYKKGNFGDALRFYDRAVEIFPGNAACRNNRAAALAGLGRLAEAVKESEDAVRLDPSYNRAHHRLASLHLRLGQVESSKKHLYLAGQQPNNVDLRKLQTVEEHLERCAESRKIGDWRSALREADAAIAAGADSCTLLIAARAEALLRLHRLDEADSTLLSLPKIMSAFPVPSCSSSKFSGMVLDSYMYIVQAQVEMALGRFESAVTAAEKARQIDSRSMEITTKLDTVKSVARARAQGNELYKSGNFAEASTAYGEGLKYDPLNPVLYCNRAACRAKLGQWGRSVEDCNEALGIHPSYVKALLRRAGSCAKLERWVEAVRDYEALAKALPNDKEVAESLFHAQVALKTSRGEVCSNMKFGGDVVEITGVEQFQAAISLMGASVVYFMDPSSEQCAKISPFVDMLCTRFAYLHFLKAASPAVAEAENVRAVPTFKIYKDGAKMKELICPSTSVLEHSVRHYGLR